MPVSRVAGSKVHKTIEDLNPRSQPVMVLKKTAERAIILREICVEIFERVGWPEILWTHPATLDGFRPRLKEIWGQQWWLHPECREWPRIVLMWRHGSLDRQIQDIAAGLPASIREKVLG